jgi:integrase
VRTDVKATLLARRVYEARRRCRTSSRRIAAGLSGWIVHDFRRTAVGNLERAGVPRSVAMKLTGHKTESVYRRYAIVAEADLREGVAKLAKLHEAQNGTTVVPLNGRRSPTAVPSSRR